MLSASANAVATAPAVLVPRPPGTPDLTKEGLYVFSGGGLELTVDPHSGSIVHLTLDGKSALAAPDAKPASYSAELEGSTLALKGADGAATKRFRLDSARRSVEITYTVTNGTAAPLRASLVDVHRVGAAGLTFFPSSQKLLPGSTLQLNVWQPLVWFPHDQTREPKALEATVEGVEGWVASVSDGLLLVKVVSDTPHPVISIASPYDAATKQRPWVEVGTRASLELPPKASATWSVRLFVRRLPPKLAPKPSNQELLGFVRGVIQ